VRLPDLPLRLRGFRMLQSISSSKPRKRMAYFHPLRPLVIRTVGFSGLGPPGKSFHFPRHPLVHFRATQAACPHACRAFTDGLGRLADHPQNAPRIRSSAFQHIRIGKPFFSFPVSRKRLENICPVFQKPRAWVWLPIPRRVLVAFRSLGTSFSSQRS
jgi:hypothetical protein